VTTGLGRRFRRNPGAIIGAVMVVAVLAAALLAPLVSPFAPGHVDLLQRLAPPTWLGGHGGHLLGTDGVGRDVLSRIIYGARISLLVGVGATVISVVIGVTLGVCAGYFGGILDDLLMRFGDMWLAFPFILLALTVMAVLGSGLWKLLAIMGIGGWVGYARIVRSEILVIKELDFVQAARAVGAPNRTLIMKHILPNAISSIIVLAALQVATNVLVEAGLTYLGLGVDPTIPTWGGMLADGRVYVTTAWWVALFPGLAITWTVMGFNLLGDWLREELDPQLRTQG
jgi:peptide/nickel transport system permease protein